MRRLLSLAVLAAAVIAPQAGATVYVEGTGEPAFTNTTTNTQWVRYVGSSSYESYKVEFDHYTNQVFNTTESATVTPNGAGTLYVNWVGIASPLVEGRTYGICAYGRYTMGGVSARETGTCSDTSKRTSTTIDRTRPTASVTIDGGAAWSRTGRLSYRIDYTDNLAFPFPANFTCRDACESPLTYDAGCSTPNEAKRITFFTCSEDRSAAADGTATFCVVSADAAVPDNPSSANQAGSAVNANLSAKACDTIGIDKTAPTAAIVPTATTVKVGDVVGFTAQASDATSGLAAQTWTWGDGSPVGNGATATHAFAAAGTFEVLLTVTDAAGNETTAKQFVTVRAAPAPQPEPEPSPNPQPTPDPIDDPADDDGDWLPEPADPAELSVRTVRQLKLTNATRTLPVELSATGAGTARITLRRAARRHVERSVDLDAELRHYRLRLPRGLEAGTYVLAVRWEPLDDESAFTTTQKKIRFVRAVKRSAIRASAASRGPLVSPVGAPVDAPTAP